MFAQYGEILMTKVVRDKNTKKSLGYGFVKFLKEDDAVYAIDKMNGFSLAQKNLKVSIARPPSLEIRNCKLYVTNLPKEYTEREVVSLFKEFGDIIECRVLKDRNSRSNKGVAFVQFNLKSQANNGDMNFISCIVLINFFFICSAQSEWMSAGGQQSRSGGQVCRGSTQEEGDVSSTDSHN